MAQASSSELLGLYILSPTVLLFFKKIFIGFGGRLGFFAFVAGTLLKYLNNNLLILTSSFYRFDRVLFNLQLPVSSIFVLLGATVTFLLRRFFPVSPVLASGMVGLVASSVCPEGSKFITFLFLGSFIGMSDLSYFPTSNPIKLIFASVVATSMCFFLQSSFAGVGGKLGTAALAGVLTSFILDKIFRSVIKH